MPDNLSPQEVIDFLDKLRDMFPEYECDMTAAIDDILYLKDCGFDFGYKM